MAKRFQYLSRACLTAAAAMLIAAPVAVAQTKGAQQPQQQAPSQQGPAAAVSEDELKAFASAALEVRNISASYAPKIAEAESKQDAKEIATLRKQAEDKMVQAVEGSGLSVEQYNKIYVVARNEPELRSRITRYMKEGDGGSGGSSAR